MNQPIDMESARRHIASELRLAVAMHLADKGAMIAEIDALTDRAAKLGICRERWEYDPRFAPFSPSRFGVETRGRKPKPYIPGIDSIGGI